MQTTVQPHLLQDVNVIVELKSVIKVEHVLRPEKKNEVVMYNVAIPLLATLSISVKVIHVFSDEEHQNGSSTSHQDIP